MGFAMILYIGFTCILGYFICKFIFSQSSIKQTLPQTWNDSEVSSCAEFQTSIEDFKQMVKSKRTSIKEISNELKDYQVIKAVDQILVEAVKKKISASKSEISMIEATIHTLRNRQYPTLDNQALSRSELIRRMNHIKNEIRPLLAIVIDALKPDQVPESSDSTSVIIEVSNEEDRQMLLIEKALTQLDTQICNLIRRTEAEGREGQQGEQRTVMKDRERRRVVLRKMLQGLQEIVKR